MDLVTKRLAPMAAAFVLAFACSWTNTCEAAVPQGTVYSRQQLPSNSPSNRLGQTSAAQNPHRTGNAATKLLRDWSSTSSPAHQAQTSNHLGQRRPFADQQTNIQRSNSGSYRPKVASNQPNIQANAYQKNNRLHRNQFTGRDFDTSPAPIQANLTSHSSSKSSTTNPSVSLAVNQDQNRQGEKQSSSGGDYLDRAIPMPGQGDSPDGKSRTKTSGYQPLIQTGIGLAVVLPLLFVFLFFMKKATPKSMQGLPNECIEVLGNTALDAKHHLKLVRLGEKLVLLSVSESSVQPVSEVTDPAEVQRLIGLCQNRSTTQAAQTFQSLLRQGEQDGSTGFLGSQQDRLTPVSRSEPSSNRSQPYLYEA